MPHANAVHLRSMFDPFVSLLIYEIVCFWYFFGVPISQMKLPLSVLYAYYKWMNLLLHYMWLHVLSLQCRSDTACMCVFSVGNTRLQMWLWCATNWDTVCCSITPWLWLSKALHECINYVLVITYNSKDMADLHINTTIEDTKHLRGKCLSILTGGGITDSLPIPAAN